MAATRHSRQREAIQAYLMSTKSHPTAESIYEFVKKEFPNISLGTVYRNLNFLVEHGDAVRLDFGDGFVHFDSCTEPHNHFLCRKCGAIIDLDMDKINHIDIIANAGFDGKIEDHILFFRGLCRKCLTSID